MRYKSIFAICLIFALFGVISFGVYFGQKVAFALSDSDITAQIVNKNESVTYMYLNGITDIFLDSDGIYIADQSGVHFKQAGQNFGTNVLEGVGVAKTQKSSGQMLYLTDLGVCLGDSTVLIGGQFFSFATLGQSIYLINSTQDRIVKYDINADEQQNLSAVKAGFEWDLSDLSAKVEGICGTSDSIVFYTQSEGDHKFYLLTSVGKTLLAQINIFDDIRCLAGNTQSDRIAILTSSSIMIYGNLLSGKASYQTAINYSGGRKLAFDNTNIYISNIRSNVDLIDYSGMDIAQSTFIGARSSVDWFYFEPNGISARNEAVYVADTLNNRVVTIDKNGFGANLGFISPVAVGSTRDGELIVAHNTNEITNVASGKTLEITSENPPVPEIKKMVIDVNNNIYALIVSNGETFLIKTDGGLSSYEILEYQNPVWVSLKTSGVACVYVDGKIYVLDDSSGDSSGGGSGGSGSGGSGSGDSSGGGSGGSDSDNNAIIIPNPLIDFYVDFANNVFGINEQNQFVSIKNGIETVFNVVDSLGKSISFNSLAISPTSVDSIGTLNDVFLIDKSTHSLWKITAEQAGVVDIMDYYPLDISDVLGNSANNILNTVLAKATAQTYLYTRPVESEISAVIDEGKTLFIRTDIPAPDNMYFAVIEDGIKLGGIITSGTMKYGYIFAQYVDVDAHPYLPQTSTYGKALIPSVSVYKYPSLYAPEISALTLGDIVTLMDFAGDYLDLDGKEWLRVSLPNDTEGFVRFQLISTSLFSSMSQLNANATVAVDTIAYVYDSANQTYAFFRSVEKGTRVEVQTPFDRTKTYTKVLFYIDNELVDIDCYMLTADIEYDGLDIIQIVAIGIIVFTILIAVILSITISRRNKRRPVHT